MTSVILNSTIESGRRRLVFQHVEGETVYGPYVEDRPIDEDPDVFVGLRRAALESDLDKPDYYALMQASLDSNIAPGTYDAVRRALKDVDSEMVFLGPGIELNVTYPTVTNPERVEDALRERVDGAVGAGTLDAVKAVLRGMGIPSVTINRKSELSL